MSQSIGTVDKSIVVANGMVRHESGSGSSGFNSGNESTLAKTVRMDDRFFLRRRDRGSEPREESTIKKMTATTGPNGKPAKDHQGYAHRRTSSIPVETATYCNASNGGPVERKRKPFVVGDTSLIAQHLSKANRAYDDNHISSSGTAGTSIISGAANSGRRRSAAIYNGGGGRHNTYDVREDHKETFDDNDAQYKVLVEMGEYVKNASLKSLGVIQAKRDSPRNEDLNDDVASVNRLCASFKHMGRGLDERYKEKVDGLFCKMRNIVKQDNVDSHVRYKLLELLEFRASNWIVPTNKSEDYNGRRKSDSGTHDHSFTRANASDQSSERSSLDNENEKKNPRNVNTAPTNRNRSVTFASQHGSPGQAVGQSRSSDRHGHRNDHKTGGRSPNLTEADSTNGFTLDSCNNNGGAGGEVFDDTVLGEDSKAVVADKVSFNGDENAGNCTTATGLDPSPAQPAVNKYAMKDQIFIKASDAGRVMGVKGKRIHQIEEISNTVISFQKDFQNNEREVTICGPEDIAIKNAKVLIRETIRRNCSPTREFLSTIPNDSDPCDSNSFLFEKNNHVYASSSTQRNYFGNNGASVLPMNKSRCKIADDQDSRCCCKREQHCMNCGSISCCDVINSDPYDRYHGNEGGARALRNLPATYKRNGDDCHHQHAHHQHHHHSNHGNNHAAQRNPLNYGPDHISFRDRSFSARKDARYHQQFNQPPPPQHYYNVVHYYKKEGVGPFSLDHPTHPSITHPGAVNQTILGGKSLRRYALDDSLLDLRSVGAEPEPELRYHGDRHRRYHGDGCYGDRCHGNHLAAGEDRDRRHRCRFTGDKFNVATTAGVASSSVLPSNKGGCFYYQSPSLDDENHRSYGMGGRATYRTSNNNTFTNHGGGMVPRLQRTKSFTAPSSSSSTRNEQQPSNSCSVNDKYQNDEGTVSSTTTKSGSAPKCSLKIGETTLTLQGKQSEILEVAKNVLERYFDVANDSKETGDVLVRSEVSGEKWIIDTVTSSGDNISKSNCSFRKISFSSADKDQDGATMNSVYDDIRTKPLLKRSYSFHHAHPRDKGPPTNGRKLINETEYPASMLMGGVSHRHGVYFTNDMAEDSMATIKKLPSEIIPPIKKYQVGLSTDPHVKPIPKDVTRVAYTRDFMIKCAFSPFSRVTPKDLPRISRVAPFLIRHTPQDPTFYLRPKTLIAGNATTNKLSSTGVHGMIPITPPALVRPPSGGSALVNSGLLYQLEPHFGPSIPNSPPFPLNMLPPQVNAPRASPSLLGVAPYPPPPPFIRGGAGVSSPLGTGQYFI